MSYSPLPPAFREFSGIEIFFAVNPSTHIYIQIHLRIRTHTHTHIQLSTESVASMRWTARTFLQLRQVRFLKSFCKRIHIHTHAQQSSSPSDLISSYGKYGIEIGLQTHTYTHTHSNPSSPSHLWRTFPAATASAVSASFSGKSAYLPLGGDARRERKLYV
jgi:hypothetical protein